ncbi:MAG: hypothetical protein MI921_06045 [Cytophagales bacterium]|nr:hypothetical protein [Cytophagales bacterium]
MNLTKILTYVFLVIAIGLAAYLVNLIYSDIERKRRIAEVEARVVEKLKMIREAQIAYQAVHGQYTSNWDKLISFINNGKIYVVERREEIIPLDYGADSLVVHVDTLDTVNVRDSLFSRVKYPNLVIEDLPLIPESNKKFEIFADKITKSGVTVDVIEVRDVDPIDKTRKEDSEIKNRRPLRFGSRTEITTSGNWGE